MFKKGLVFLFLFFEKIKRSIFLNVFGYHIVCKHKPSCSYFFLKSIEKDGLLIGFLKSFMRIITCF